MRFTTCPTATINAPVETVLRLLELRNFGQWADGRIVKLRPEGPMVPGQEATLSVRAFGIPWKVVIRFIGMDAAARKIRYDVFDPFGLKNEEEMDYAPLTATSCRITYNCNFIFPDGARGWLIKTFLGRRMVEVPKDSIARLKAAAERAYEGR